MVAPHLASQAITFPQQETSSIVCKTSTVLQRRSHYMQDVHLYERTLFCRKVSPSRVEPDLPWAIITIPIGLLFFLRFPAVAASAPSPSLLDHSWAAAFVVMYTSPARKRGWTARRRDMFVCPLKISVTAIQNADWASSELVPTRASHAVSMGCCDLCLFVSL